MNAQDIQANWHKLKGELRKNFGKLTDDDMLAIEGQAEALTGKLQERYNLSLDEANEVITGLYLDEEEGLKLKTTLQGEGDIKADRRFREAQHEFAADQAHKG